MPTTITASNGNVYHLWQLTCQVKDYTEDVEYTTLDNELADGYWSQILYGSEVGVRTFNLTLPTVTDSTNDTVTGPVSYTHLTLPTIYSCEISVCDVAVKI